jgi:hypothetical protein
MPLRRTVRVELEKGATMKLRIGMAIGAIALFLGITGGASAFPYLEEDAGVAAASPSVFASVPAPIGVAATPARLIVSEYCTGNLDRIDDLGTVSFFASVPGYPVGTCIEMYLAISPGLGTWTANDIYATEGGQVWKISPDGSTVSPFATIPACGTTHSGITFDHVGTFGLDMIVTCNNGNVYRLNSAGTPTFVASTGTFLEGPAIPAVTFGPLGGQIWAADENSGTVWAISSGGSVTPAVSSASPESVHVIPPNPCSFGNSNGALFSAMYADNQIWKWPPSDLTGLGGDVLVTSEFGGGIALVTFNGTSYVTSTFSSEPDQHEGSALVDCAVPPPTERCPFTQGYWKNHSDAWPVTSLTLGSETYTEAELLAILRTPVRGDASLILVHQLIAAKLNIANGSDPTPVSATIANADTLLSAFAGKLPYNVRPSSSTGQAMVSDAATLDNYNGGQFTPDCSS